MLTVASVKAATKPGEYHDRGGVRGLYLRVAPGGSKQWLYRFQLRGKRNWFGLGGVNDVTLAEARERAMAARKQVKSGINPVDAKRGERKAAEEAAALAKVEEASRRTFDECAAAYYDANVGRWSASHAQQWKNSVARYASPVIGNLPVHLVDKPAVIAVLTPVWAVKPETADRVRARIEATLDFAAAHGHRPAGDNPAKMEGHLEHVFTKRSSKERERQPAVHFDEMPRCFAEIAAHCYEANARALMLTILSASRIDEVLKAEWREFDFDKRVWLRPASHMKARKPHAVPLTDAMIELLGEPGAPDARVFDMDANTLRRAMPAGYKDRETGRDAVPHGFRSSFSDWVRARTQFEYEAREMCLAHSVGNAKVQGAYNRDDLIAKRRPIIEAWNRYCLEGAAIGGDENVVPLAG